MSTKNTIVKNKKQAAVRSVLTVLILLWCTLIFYMSNEPADMSADRSTGLAKRLIEAFVRFFGGDAQDAELIDQLEFLLRKGAHMFLFFVLAVLSSLLTLTFDIKLVGVFAFSSVFSLLYSISDELHQLYVPGRSGSLKDVGVDMAGALMGSAFIVLISSLRKRVHSHQ